MLKRVKSKKVTKNMSDVCNWCGKRNCTCM